MISKGAWRFWKYTDFAAYNASAKTNRQIDHGDLFECPK